MRKTGTLRDRGAVWATCLMTALLLGACSPAPSAAGPSEASGTASAPEATATSAPAELQSTSPAASMPVAAADNAAAVPSTLTEGMAYADLRAFVLAKGWKPKVDAECKANVVGGDYEALCKSSPDRCKVCDDAPELSSCSADGHCLMNFERGNETLTVSTYGEIRDWNVSGKASGLAVKWWDPESAAK